MKMPPSHSRSQSSSLLRITKDKKESEALALRMTLSLIDFALHVSVHRETNFYRNVLSFFVYMIPLRDLAAE